MEDTFKEIPFNPFNLNNKSVFHLKVPEVKPPLQKRRTTRFLSTDGRNI